MLGLCKWPVSLKNRREWPQTTNHSVQERVHTLASDVTYMWPITRPRRVVYLKRQQFIESGLSTHTSATSACADASRSFSFFLYLSALARSCSCTCIHVWNGLLYSSTYEWKSGERRKERRESRDGFTCSAPIDRTATLRPMRRVASREFDACFSDDRLRDIAK